MVNLFGFWVFGKNKGCNGLKLEINKLKCKIEHLEVLGHWSWNLRATEGFQGPFPRVGENDL